MLPALQPPACLAIISPGHAPYFYSAPEWSALAARTELLTERPLSAEEALARPDLLTRVEILFNGSGGPFLAGRPLDHAIRRETLANSA